MNLDRHLPRLALAALALSSEPPSAAAGNAGKLVVEVSARPTRRSREGAVVELDGVPFGGYAIGCIHDENGNGKLDTNLIGIPKEGVCASNDARGKHGPPRWSDARFDFRADPTTLQIHVRY